MTRRLLRPEPLFVCKDSETHMLMFLLCIPSKLPISALQWCHNGRDGVSNQQPVFTQPFIEAQSKESIKAPVTGEFPAQMDCNAENVSIWWRHHVIHYCLLMWLVAGQF